MAILTKSELRGGQPAETRKPGRSWSLRWRWVSPKVRWTVLFVLGALILLRLALPFAIKAYVNRQLDKMPDYDGHVGDVDVHLWRGAYRIRDLEIVKTTGRIPVPLFAADTLDLSMEWKELFHGALVGEVIMVKPAMHFVAGPTPEDSQTGKDRPWVETLESLFPFKLNKVQIEEGQIRFQNFHSKPPVDIFIHRLSATATNLTNTRDLLQQLPAGLSCRGATLGDGDVDLELRMNLFAKVPTFELSGQVTNVDLVSLNDFLKAYGKFDVARGKFALFASFAAAEGKYEGYAKVFFEDLDVFEWEKERKKNAWQIAWHSIVGTLATVLRNQPKDTLAAKIPMAGSFEKGEVGIWAATATLLRNAFIQALVPKLDSPVEVEEVREERKP